MIETMASSRLVTCIDPTSGIAGTSALTGATVDSKDYREVLFIVQVGTIVSTGTLAIKAQAGALANGSDMADVAGTGTTAVQSTDSNTVFFIDITFPTFRYWRVVATRGTANSTVSATCLLSSGADNPTTAANLGKGKTVLSPAYGTP